jgi:predicted metal-dependent RNase
VARRCDAAVFDFSGHAPREHLVDFACRLRPRRVFLVHGDEGACRWFRETLTAALPDTEMIVPQPGITHAF